MSEELITAMSASSGTTSRRRELSGWKQITNYLGIAEKTARKYARNEGLPVRKRGGRYYAYSDEIDRWKVGETRQRVAPEPQPQTLEFETGTALEANATSSRPWSPERGLSAGLLGVVVALTISVLAVLWQIKRFTEASEAIDSALDMRGRSSPEGYNLRGSTLRIVDAEGRHLWSVSIKNSYWLSETPPMFEDVDDDGFKEVLFNHWPLNNKVENGKLICFDHDGSELWEFPYGQLSGGREHRFNGRYFEPFFSGEHVEYLETPSGTFILTIARHTLWYPTQIALLRPDSGELVSDYWHPGYIYAVELFDVGHDGTMELLVGGANNPDDGYSRPGLAVLKMPFSEPHGEQNFFGAWNQREVEYLLFPIFDLFKAQGHGAAVQVIEAMEPDRLALRVGLPPESYLLYYLDHNLRLTDVRPSDKLVSIHDNHFFDNKLDHKYGQKDLDLWRRIIRLPSAPDGNREEVEAWFDSP